MTHRNVTYITIMLMATVDDNHFGGNRNKKS